MSKRIIALITMVSVAAFGFAGCTDKTAETSSEETSAAVTEAAAEITAAETTVETTAAETTAAETTESESDGIPQPGDTYNGHTVDHTEDQPDCDDSSHGTIWIFYTDSDVIDFITY